MRKPRSFATVCALLGVAIGLTLAFAINASVPKSTEGLPQVVPITSDLTGEPTEEVNIYHFHDPEKAVLCWVFTARNAMGTITGSGISCLPVALLEE